MSQALQLATPTAPSTTANTLLMLRTLLSSPSTTAPTSLASLAHPMRLPTLVSVTREPLLSGFVTTSGALAVTLPRSPSPVSHPVVLLSTTGPTPTRRILSSTVSSPPPEMLSVSPSTSPPPRTTTGTLWSLLSTVLMLPMSWPVCARSTGRKSRLLLPPSDPPPAPVFFDPFLLFTPSLITRLSFLTT